MTLLTLALVLCDAKLVLHFGAFVNYLNGNGGMGGSVKISP